MLSLQSSSKSERTVLCMHVENGLSMTSTSKADLEDRRLCTLVVNAREQPSNASPRPRSAHDCEVVVGLGCRARACASLLLEPYANFTNAL